MAVPPERASPETMPLLTVCPTPKGVANGQSQLSNLNLIAVAQIRDRAASAGTSSILQDRQIAGSASAQNHPGCIFPPVRASHHPNIRRHAQQRDSWTQQHAVLRQDHAGSKRVLQPAADGAVRPLRKKSFERTGSFIKGERCWDWVERSVAHRYSPQPAPPVLPKAQSQAEISVCDWGTRVSARAPCGMHQ